MRNIYLVGGTTARTDLDNYVSANISKKNAIESMKKWEDFQVHDDFHIDSIEIDDIEEFESQIRKDAMKEHFRNILDFINTSNRGNCDYFIVDQIENYIGDYMKERDDEKNRISDCTRNDR